MRLPNRCGRYGPLLRRRLALAPIVPLLAVLTGCAGAGPPVLGPLFSDPTGLSEARGGRLVEHPQWLDGPDNIDFRLYARLKAVQKAAHGAEAAAGAAVASWPDRPTALECVITEADQLSLCAPYPGLEDLSPEAVRPYLAATHLATSMQLAPLDLDGQPVAGGRVRLTIQWPAQEPAPSDDDVVPARILNPPSPFEYARLYPARALETAVDGDVILLCIVAASGLGEGCEVFFESVSEVGFGQASQEVYRNIRVLPTMINGEPRRTMAMAVVRWRLQ